MRQRIASLIAASTLILSAAAFAQQGPGMMHGYGGGYGMGPGMMGPGMMGPGMMGPGMMGHGMMGPGMMGGYGYGGVDLTPEQRTKMSEIQQKLAQQHWDLMGKMHQQGYRGMDIYRDGKLNEQTARKHYETMMAAHKQMFESWLQAEKEMDALLTPEQRKQFQKRWQGR